MIGKIKKPTGFTLVEILTIVALISAIIFFLSASIPSLIARARDGRRKANIKRIAQAVEEYRDDNECYPYSIPGCGYDFKDGDFVLLDNIPCDPETKNSYIYVPDNATCPQGFQLYGNLEYVEDPIIQKIGCGEGCGPACEFNYGASSTNQKLDPYCGAIPVPPPPPDQYACSPPGNCELYENPIISGCPNIFLNDPTCLNQCSNHENRCHDEKGKFIPK